MTKGRTKKNGLLSERERKFLQNKEKMTYHQKWDFLKNLDSRIKDCIEDIELIWESTKEDPSMKQWASKNKNQLYTLADSIHPRKYGTLKPIKPGKIRIVRIKEKGKERATIHFWLDEKTEYLGITGLSWPDYMIKGIKPKTVQNRLREILILEDSLFSKNKIKDYIIPRTEFKALPLKKIEKKIEKIKTKSKTS